LTAWATGDLNMQSTQKFKWLQLVYYSKHSSMIRIS